MGIPFAAEGVDGALADKFGFTHQLFDNRLDGFSRCAVRIDIGAHPRSIQQMVGVFQRDKDRRDFLPVDRAVGADRRCPFDSDLGLVGFRGNIGHVDDQVAGLGNIGCGLVRPSTPIFGSNTETEKPCASRLRMKSPQAPLGP